MGKRLDELKSLCDKNSIVVNQTGSRVSRQDYVDALAKFVWNRDNAGQTMIPQFTPILARNIKDFREDHHSEGALKREMLRDGSLYTAEEKINGCRALVHLGWFKDLGKNWARPEGQWNAIVSRNVSDVDFRMNEIHDNVPHVRDMPVPQEFWGMILDCEVVSSAEKIDTEAITTRTELQSTTALLNSETSKSIRIQQTNGPLILVVFDIGDLSGSMDQTFRWKKLDRFFTWYRSWVVTKESMEGYLKVFPQETPSPDVRHRVFKSGEVRYPAECLYQIKRVEEGKEAFYEEIVRSGGEGVMFRHRRGKYATQGRSKDLVKRKKFIEMDAFVSGFQLGEEGTANEHLVGSLDFSCYDSSTGRPVVVGRASNIEHVDRVKWTVPGKNGPTLDPEIYGRVAEVRGQEFSARNYRLSHCNILRWREGVDGKNAEDCIVDIRAIANAFESESEAAQF